MRQHPAYLLYLTDRTASFIYSALQDNIVFGSVYLSICLFCLRHFVKKKAVSGTFALKTTSICLFVYAIFGIVRIGVDSIGQGIILDH